MQFVLQEKLTADIESGCVKLSSDREQETDIGSPFSFRSDTIELRMFDFLGMTQDFNII